MLPCASRDTFKYSWNSEIQNYVGAREMCPPLRTRESRVWKQIRTYDSSLDRDCRQRQFQAGLCKTDLVSAIIARKLTRREDNARNEGGSALSCSGQKGFASLVFAPSFFRISRTDRTYFTTSWNLKVCFERERWRPWHSTFFHSYVFGVWRETETVSIISEISISSKIDRKISPIFVTWEFFEKNYSYRSNIPR